MESHSRTPPNIHMHTSARAHTHAMQGVSDEGIQKVNKGRGGSDSKRSHTVLGLSLFSLFVFQQYADSDSMSL